MGVTYIAERIEPKITHMGKVIQEATPLPIDDDPYHVHIPTVAEAVTLRAIRRIRSHQSTTRYDKLAKQALDWLMDKIEKGEVPLEDAE